jgi:hypothetical protein
MTKRNVLTGVLAIALVASTLPAAAETPSEAFRASLDRAAASVAAAPAAPKGVQTNIGSRGAKKAAASRSEEATQAISGGGGMSKTAIVTLLVTTVAGAAGTYYMIKEMRKVTSGIPTTPGQ